MHSLLEEAEMLLGLKFVLSGMNFPIEQAKSIVFGVPLDVTSTGKRGSNFGPNSLRQASIDFMGTFSNEKRIHYFEKNPSFDLGDLAISPANLPKTLSNVQKLTELILSHKKIPVMLGGEHTISLGALKAFEKLKPKVIVFDAHLDLLNEFNEDKIMHGTVFRRAMEFLSKENFLFIGISAVEKEELDFVEKNKLNVIYLKDLRKDFSKAKEKIEKFSNGKQFYLSFDIDALHPHIVPGTGTVQPDGLTFQEALGLLNAISGKIVGLDLVEIAPDQNFVTQTTAAKLLIELMSMGFW